MFYIYTILNRLNYKMYVGQTQNPKNRWSSHRSVANSDKAYLPVHRALKKYGATNFQYSIIDVLNSQEEANEAEEFWIAQLDSRGKEGYNLASGGSSNSGWHHSEESKEKIARSNLGKKKPKSLEQRKLLSDLMTGRQITWAQKISESQTKFPAEMESKIVSEYRVGASCKSLGNKYGCSTRTIYNIIKRRERYGSSL